MIADRDASSSRARRGDKTYSRILRSRNEEGERGCIINTASIAAFEGQIGQVAYSAAKAGIVGMTFVMARDLGSLGIRANCIAPSLFDTGLTSAIPDEFALQLTKDAAFPKRMGNPSDLYVRKRHDEWRYSEGGRGSALRTEVM